MRDIPNRILRISSNGPGYKPVPVHAVEYQTGAFLAVDSWGGPRCTSKAFERPTKFFLTKFIDHFVYICCPKNLAFSKNIHANRKCITQYVLAICYAELQTLITDNLKQTIYFTGAQKKLIKLDIVSIYTGFHTHSVIPKLEALIIIY